MGSLSRGTKQELFSILPAGTVLPFAGGTAPEGWAICDGSTVSRSEYSELYLAIGDSWGNGDGSTTFHLPDMRGRFLRGSTQGMDPLDAAERDPDYASRTAANSGGNTGDNVGSLQADEFASHNHNILPSGSGTNQGAGSWLQGTVARLSYGSLNTGATGGNETRPKNVNINYIIKL